MQTLDPQSSLRCSVVDDEPLAAQLIASYVKRTPGLVLSGVYSRVEDAVQAMADGSSDLVFLDIDMPRMTGIELAELLPPRTRVVFTTAYANYAVEGFRLNALHYLLKPVSYEEFLGAVRRAREVHQAAPASEPDRQYITVRSEYRLVRLAVADIEYVESLKDYVKIYVEGQPQAVLTLMSLKAVEQILPSGFMRVHRSYIVNLDKARVVERNRIVFGKRSVPISDSYRAEFLRHFGASVE